MKHLTFTEIQNTDEVWMEQIARLRVEVWREEAHLNEDLFQDGKWLEVLDNRARHWIVKNSNGELLSAARLTIHHSLKDNPDGYLWLKNNRSVPVPAAHLCKLVVRREARGCGIASQLNQIRLQAAKTMGAKSILVTASDANARLLVGIGFVDTGIVECFENRPGFPFRAMEYVFREKKYHLETPSLLEGSSL